MDTQHTRCNRVNPLLHEGCSRPVQPLETTALQRGTGLLIIPWSLVRIQAGPVYFAEYRPVRSGKSVVRRVMTLRVFHTDLYVTRLIKD